jgi:hypothetical protein
MPLRKIGSALDALGAQVDVPDGYSITGAEVSVTLSPPEDSEKGAEWEEKLSLPIRPPGQTPVPHPVVRHVITVVEEGQNISDAQRQRVIHWLRANGVDPARVAAERITLEYKMYGEKKGRQLIGFTQFHLEDGNKVHAYKTNDVVKFQRYVEQTVELEPDPTWEGWQSGAEEKR